MSSKVRLGVAFDGEKEVKSAVSNINAQLKTLKSEADKVKSAFEGQEKSEEALKAKTDVLSRTMQVHAAKVKEVQDAVKKAQAHEEEWKGKIAKTADELGKERKKLDEMKSSTDASTDEIEKQEKAVADLEKKLHSQEETLTKANTNTEKWKTTLNKTETELNKTQKELDQTETELKDVAQGADKAGDEMKDMGDSAGNMSGKVSKMAVAWGTFMGNLALDALKSAARAVKDFAGGVVELGKNFDTSMSNVKALSGATDQELERLTATAREAGKTTVFSAQESADALGYMALAGWDVNQMVDGLPSVLDLAAAAQMDLAEASDIVTDNVTAFGLSAKDSGHFADVMAYAMAHSNTDVTMLGESYKNCAATAASLGYSVEETTAVLMTMANAGVKGGEAGTSLNAVMTRLATDTKGCASVLAEYDVRVYDAQGNMNSLSDILNGTAKIWGDLTQEEQANLAKTIAGQNHYAKFQTIMAGLSDKAKETGQSFTDYTEALKNCDGAASDMSKTMNDNLAGDLKTLNSVTEDLKLTLYNMESSALRGVVQCVTSEVLPAFEALITGADDAKEQIGEAFNGLLDNLGDVGGNLVATFFGEEAGAAVTEAFDVIGDAIKDLMGVLDELGPTIGEIISTASEIIQTLMPVVVQLIEKLAPVIHSIVESAGKLVSAILPPIAGIISTIIDVLGPLFDLITAINTALGWVFDGIGAVFSGIGWLLSGCPKVAENFEEVMEATDKLSKELDKSADSWDRMLESQEKAYAEDAVEISKIESMAEALDEIVDENGKILQGYEGRAQYLTGELRNATGVELECVDGTIKKYGELKQSIEDVIAMKKAESLQSYYQKVTDTFEGGVDQLNHQIAVTRNEMEELQGVMANTSQNTDEWNEASARYEELGGQIERLSAQRETAYMAEARLSELEVAMAEGNADAIKRLCEEKQTFYFDETGAYIASKEEMVEAEREGLEGRNGIIELQKKYVDSTDTAMHQVLDSHQKHANKVIQNGENEKNALIRSNALKLQRIKADTSTFSGQVIAALQNAGQSGSSGYASGISSASGSVRNAAAGLKSSASSGVSGSHEAGKTEGSNFGQGYANGISGWIQSAYDWAYSLTQKAKVGAKAGQESSSPSKVARGLGHDFAAGYALGIEDDMKKAQKAATEGAQMTVRSLADVQVTAIPSLGVMNAFDGISGQNVSLLAAMSGLRQEIRDANLGTSVYQIDGVTYDDGSNVAGAVQSLVRAVRIERRV